MKEDENIETYFLRVDGVVQSIRGLVEKLEDHSFQESFEISPQKV